MMALTSPEWELDMGRQAGPVPHWESWDGGNSKRGGAVDMLELTCSELTIGL